jgi:hypothetical protein
MWFLCHSSFGREGPYVDVPQGLPIIPVEFKMHLVCFDCVPLDSKRPPKISAYVNTNAAQRLFDYKYLPGSVTYYDYALNGAGLFGRAGRKDWDGHHYDEKSYGDDPPKLPALSDSNEEQKFSNNENFPGSIKQEYDNAPKGAGHYGSDGHDGGAASNRVK